MAGHLVQVFHGAPSPESDCNASCRCQRAHETRHDPYAPGRGVAKQPHGTAGADGTATSLGVTAAGKAFPPLPSTVNSTASIKIDRILNICILSTAEHAKGGNCAGRRHRR